MRINIYRGQVESAENSKKCRKMVERGWLEKKGNSKNTVYIKCSTENEEVSNDKFYSEKNIKHLKKGMKALDLGKGVEHELIEEEDE